jgi:hypothetical protein
LQLGDGQPAVRGLERKKNVERAVDRADAFAFGQGLT